jgi:hypothetical protein
LHRHREILSGADSGLPFAAGWSFSRREGQASDDAISGIDVFFLVG